MPNPNKPSFSASPARAAADARTRFNFAGDHVLGTSFGLAVDAVRPADAAQQSNTP